MAITRWVCIVVVLFVSAASRAEATPRQDLEFALRGKTLVLSVYRPAGRPVGTVVMGSGDVGWVGLAVTMSEYLSDHGYLVVGVNVRQYLSAFRVGNLHLTVQDPPADFRAIADFLRQRDMLVSPVIMSGVSEGAALAVLAASDAKNHTWIDGVVTMGIPRTAELAWKWTDFTSWITKSDAAEPSFSPYDFIGSVAPRPLVMIQSTRDEYVSEPDYTRCHKTANDPKKLVLINASNHRFTDRLDELRKEYVSALGWIRDPR